MKNKKPILIIVLALVVIGAIVFFILTREVKPDPASVQCARFCEINHTKAFCNVEIKADKNTKATCIELSTNPSYAKFGVASCPAISCDSLNEVDMTCVTGLGGKWVFPDEEGKCPPDPDGIKILIKKDEASDAPPIEGQICCR